MTDADFDRAWWPWACGPDEPRQRTELLDGEDDNADVVLIREVHR